MWTSSSTSLDASWESACCVLYALWFRSRKLHPVNLAVFIFDIRKQSTVDVEKKSSKLHEGSFVHSHLQQYLPAQLSKQQLEKTDIRCVTCAGHRCVQGRCIVPQALPLPLPFPRIFKPSVLRYGDLATEDQHSSGRLLPTRKYSSYIVQLLRR